MSGIYDASMDNVSCLLPKDRPGETWSRWCNVVCCKCGREERFTILASRPVQTLADSALESAMVADGWVYGGVDADDDVCPTCVGSGQ